MNNYLIKFKYTGDEYDLLDLIRVNEIEDKNYLSYMISHNFNYVKKFGYKCVSRSYLTYHGGYQFLDQKKQSEEFIVIFDMNFNFEFSERSRILLPIIETIRDYKISRVLL